ncbi:MAG: hypothetical protein H7A51_10790 [Akkermansiaceae bacterium]|nr:hypothetical protein [Akkermansiaceae bacterium]
MSDTNIIESKAGPLEKIGHAVLRRMGPTCPGGTSVEEQRVLSDDEQLLLKKIVRWTVFRAALAGALSAVAAACAAVYAERRFGDELVAYWLVFGGVSLLAAVLEVGFLYFDALRAVHRISAASDVELFPQGDERSRMAGVMVRAAMELPNPPDRDPYVNPFRRASKWRILLGALVYKGKILVTNALAKVVVRKILLRGAARAWLEFVAVPVTAAWNAVVCFWVLREARIRAIGPSALQQVLPELLAQVDAQAAEAAQRAVGCCVLASRDLHPNHLRMLEMMREVSGIEVTELADDHEEFLRNLSDLKQHEREVVLDLYVLAVLVDGRISKGEKALLAQALRIHGAEPAHGWLREARNSFRRGYGVPLLSDAL